MKNQIRSSVLWESVLSRWCMPDRVVDELCWNPTFLEAFRSHVGLRTAFTLRTHSLTVMNCYERHFAPRFESDARARAMFRLFLALHDIGKPNSIAAGDKRWQHRFTVAMMRESRNYFLVTDEEFEDWIALVDGDPIGGFLKREISLSVAADQIRAMQDRSSLKLTAFWKLLIVYYQCDASSYTSRAGLMNALDGLFDWNETRDEIMFDERTGFLKFSGPVLEALNMLMGELSLEELK